MPLLTSNVRLFNSTLQVKKDFEEILPNQLREIFACFHQQQKEADELSILIKEKPDSLKLLSEVPPWSYLYELPYKTFLAIGIITFDLADIIHKVANSDNPIKLLLEDIQDEDNTLDINEELSDEEKALKFSVLTATTNQISSLSIHGHTLNALVQKARDGDDESLFDAVLVDRSIVSAPTIAHRIQIAHLTDDENFMELLSKAIKRSRPRRPTEELDALRYMIEVLDEVVGLNNITNDKLYDILSEDLELYDKSLDGFMKIIQRRNKSHRT